MSEERLRRALREVDVPDRRGAEERALTMVRAAVPTLAARADREAAAGVAGAGSRSPLAVGPIAALVSPAGAAVRGHFVRDAVEDEHRPAQPALTSLPGRRQPAGRFPAGALGSSMPMARSACSAPTRNRPGLAPRPLRRRDEKLLSWRCIDPEGEVRWTVYRGCGAGPPGPPDGFRIAYLNGSQLRLIAGDGSGDRPGERRLAGCPAWVPGAGRALSFVATSGRIRTLSVDTGEQLLGGAGAAGVEARDGRATAHACSSSLPGELQLRARSGTPSGAAGRGRGLLPAAARAPSGRRRRRCSRPRAAAAANSPRPPARPGPAPALLRPRPPRRSRSTRPTAAGSCSPGAAPTSGSSSTRRTPRRVAVCRHLGPVRPRDHRAVGVPQGRRLVLPPRGTSGAHPPRIEGMKRSRFMPSIRGGWAPRSRGSAIGAAAPAGDRGERATAKWCPGRTGRRCRRRRRHAAGGPRSRKSHWSALLQASSSQRPSGEETTPRRRPRPANSRASGARPDPSRRQLAAAAAREASTADRPATGRCQARRRTPASRSRAGSRRAAAAIEEPQLAARRRPAAMSRRATRPAALRSRRRRRGAKSSRAGIRRRSPGRCRRAGEGQHVRRRRAARRESTGATGRHQRAVAAAVRRRPPSALPELR